MNYRKMQRLISDIIRRELSLEFEKNFEDRTEEAAKEAEKLNNSWFELQNKLKKKLDKEGLNILDQLIDLTTEIAINENEYYFERGVRCGLSDLKYLEKYCQIF